MSYFPTFRAAVLKHLPGWEMQPGLRTYEHAVHPSYPGLHLVFGLPRTATDLTVVHAVYPRNVPAAATDLLELTIPRSWPPRRVATELTRLLLPGILAHYRKALADVPPS